MKQGKITANSLNLRTNPDAGSTIIASFTKEKIVEIIDTVTGGNYSTSEGTKNQWYQVKIDGKIGFMAAFFIVINDSFDLNFNFPEPKDEEKIKKLTLWSTFYHVHQAKASKDSSAIPLLNLDREPLGPKLLKQDWCKAALEGTVQVEDPVNTFTTYNFAGRGTTAQTNCSFPSLKPETVQAINRSLFKKAKGPYGDGAGGFILVPYRTIATDKTKIALGTVLFIPDARGKEIILPSGDKVKHDGYFFAADVGGAIKDNHIDTFLGVTDKNPFAHVKSSSDATFNAFIIDNEQIENTLKDLHT